MNPVIRAQLREYSRNNSLSLISNDQQFEIFSIFSTLSGLLGESIDAYDVHLKGNEFGIDGIAITIQGEAVFNRQETEEKIKNIKNPVIEFIFFQSKISTSFDYGNISKFYDAVSGFFNGDLAGESPALDDLISSMNAIYEMGIGKRNPKISCYYITTGNYEKPDRTEKLKSRFKEQLSELNVFDNDNIVIEMVGARDLQQWYRAATSAVEVEIEFPRNVVMPVNNNVEEAYIGYIDAKNLLKLCTAHDSNGEIIGINRAVFFDNIRDYDSKSKINTSIKDSVVQSDGAEFVFRNNGITIVSKNIDRTGDRFKLEDFQIVNGCQTTNIIFEIINDKSQSVEKLSSLEENIQIPFRLIGSKDDEFVSSIIVGTNRQNPVKDEQFWALRSFMKGLEEYCRNLENEEIIYLERRENQYRTQEIERTRIMQPSVLMKAVAACLLFQPHRAARDYRGILSEYESDIFLEDHDVRLYHAVAYLYYSLEFLWRNQRMDGALKTFRYYILTGIGLSFIGDKNVFGVSRKEIGKISQLIIDLCKKEDRLKARAEEIVLGIEAQLSELNVSGQEKIRDTIRSEAFANKFKERITKN